MNSSCKSKLAKWSSFRLKRNIRRDTAIQSWQSRIKVLAFSEKLMVELRRFVVWLLVDDRRLGVPKKSTLFQMLFLRSGQSAIRLYGAPISKLHP